MNNLVSQAVETVNIGEQFFTKFLAANDTGETGGHQAGIYISKNAVPILFDTPGVRGQNKDRFVQIRWQGDFTTRSRFIYYGQRTRNEYRITQFGRGFPFLQPNHTGDLFVLVQMDDNEYEGFIFSTEDEIEEFLNTIGISSVETGQLFLSSSAPKPETASEIQKMIADFDTEFPETKQMAKAARDVYYATEGDERNLYTDPDEEIINWVNMEYRLFRELESTRYSHLLNEGFATVDEFVEVANRVLNRRKSRAGKSLEHHVATMFDYHGIRYSAQMRTENNKKPDFIMPGDFAYHDLSYASDNLTFLGVKTTCKDRWRQILNEADRIKTKHLFTLQQGISTNQLEEMESEQVQLVVPNRYINAYPASKRPGIWTLSKFMEYVKEKQA